MRNVFQFFNHIADIDSRSDLDKYWKMEKEKIEIKSMSQVPSFEPEGRKYPRFSAGLPIEYCRINGSHYRPGHTINISEGGVMVSLSEKIEIGDNLKMKLFFSSGPDLNTIETMVQVVWADIQVMEDRCYRLGVNFVDISPENKEKLKSFIDLYADLKTPPQLKTSVGGGLNPSNPSVPTPQKLLTKIKPFFNFFSFIFKFLHQL